MWDAADQVEQVLRGGNTSVVVRVGDTVRRESGHWTPAVHALLAYLHDVGFDGAPTVLGLDQRGREVLEYVEGDVGLLGPGQPLPPWFVTDEAAYEVGDWLRRFHDTQRGFEPDPSLPWRLAGGRPLGQGEVIVHHDVAPYNTVRDTTSGPAGERLTLLDWDFCAPGDPMKDVAFSVWQWVPLWADRQAVAAGHGGAATPAQAARRTAVLLDGYHPTAAQRGALVDVVAAEMRHHGDTVQLLAAAGDQAFAALVRDGVAREARLDADWVERHRDVIEQAIGVVG